MAVKQTITYKDLDENEVTEDWYFSLGKTDMMEMDFVHDEDVAAYLKQIFEEKNTRELLHVWKELLFRAVGKRVGNRLVKNDEVLAEFRESGAYEQFFSNIIESDDAGASFFISIMPQEIQDKVIEEENRKYSKEELLAMTDEEFYKTFGKDETSYSPEVLLVAFQRKNKKAA